MGEGSHRRGGAGRIWGVGPDVLNPRCPHPAAQAGTWPGLGAGHLSPGAKPGGGVGAGGWVCLSLDGGTWKPGPDSAPPRSPSGAGGPQAEQPWPGPPRCPSGLESRGPGGRPGGPHQGFEGGSRGKPSAARPASYERASSGASSRRPAVPAARAGQLGLGRARHGLLRARLVSQVGQGLWCGLRPVTG